MKTSISRFLLLGAMAALLSLMSACSPQNSSAQSPTSPPPAPSQASVPPTPATPATPVAPAIPAIPAMAEVPVTPATIPPNIAPTSPLAQVVRMAQAGVDESIIMVYVTNSSRTFNLDADKIVYLTDLGLPTEMVTAIMQQDQKLQQEFAAAQAEQQAQQLPPAPPTQAAPAPEPAAADTAVAMTPPAPVTVNYFNETLSPYGSWVVVNGYGNCWRPAVCTYNPAWQPYCDRGHWVYTDCGWYWSSDYAWGATFHYGRWFRDASVGWCWSPDTVWAPSWVTWRYSDNYCGWAPLPPQTYCQAGVGIVYQGSGVSVGLSFGLGASCFTFVPTQYFCNPHPKNYCAPPSQATQIYNNTTVINNIRIHGSGHNQIVINNGIPVQGVVNSTRTPIRPLPVQQVDPGFAHGGSAQPANRPSRVFNRPSPTDSANNVSPQPARANQTGPANSVAGQNSPRSTVMAGTAGTRPGQSHFSQPGNSQTQPARQGQFNQGQTRVQPERITQVATANNNYNAQAAPARWQQPQPGTPNNYPRTSEPRQNYGARNRVVAPPVTYSAPPSSQPQARSYSQPRAEIHQNYSPAPAVSAPQPQRSAPSVASAPQPQRSAPSVASSSAPQSQGGGRMSNPNWGPR